MERIEPRMTGRGQPAQPAPRPMPPVAHAPPPPAAHRWMQLRLRRSQRIAGVVSSKVVFGLDARAELTPHAQALVQKYRLGPLVLYDSQARAKYQETIGAHFQASSQAAGVGGQLAGLARGLATAALASMTLRITVDSLMKGHHIECKDLQELLGAEEALAQACENIKAYLDVAETFDGRELVLEF